MRGSVESKHNYLMLLSLFNLTCFGLYTGPSSGHKIYNQGDYTVCIIKTAYDSHCFISDSHCIVSSIIYEDMLVSFSSNEIENEREKIV